MLARVFYPHTDQLGTWTPEAPCAVQEVTMMLLIWKAREQSSTQAVSSRFVVADKHASVTSQYSMECVCASGLGMAFTMLTRKVQ